MRFLWFAWTLVIAIPGVIYAYLTHLQVDHQIIIFSAVAASMLLLWIFSLLTDFVPALLGLLMLALFGLAPESVVLSGFSSSSFLLAFSIMGVSVAIVESGVTRRYTLILLKHLPANTVAHQLAVFMTGLLFTPTVPIISGRATIVGPVVNHIVAGWDEKTRRSSSTMLYTSGLDSIHYLSPWFLTAAPANLIVFALLPAQDQQTFQFLFWAFAASVTSVALLLFYFLCSAFFFRHAYRRVQLPHAAIEQEMKELGPISSTEWTTLFSILLLVVGIVAEPWHKIEIHYVAFSVLCLLLYFGTLKREDFIAKIDWAFLFLLASMIGILATMHHLNIESIIISKLSWLGVYMRQDFILFVLMLSVAILIIRLLIPLNQAIAILAITLLPIASNASISPWVVGFIILIISETAFFSYQSPYIFLFRNITREISWQERKVQQFHGLLFIFKLLAICISIPFWQRIGVL